MCMAAPPPCMSALVSQSRERSGWALPRVLAIGGSDSSCGAGIQADLQSIAANGGHPVTAVTAVTAQHSRGVAVSSPLDPALVAAQVAAAYADAPPAAVKTGMLASRVTVEALARQFRDAPPPILVVDPVICASSGLALLDQTGIEALCARLLPLATLVTPNVPEAEALSGIEVHTPGDAEEAGRRILALGARAVLVKGGHLAAAPATDVLVTTAGVLVFGGSHIRGREVHGTGCTYASAITTHLAHGCSLEDAIRAAKGYVEAVIGTAVRVGTGAFMADHLAAARVAWEDAP
ncbi:MAG: bifunctional hydroxymethylpyrimidine kinase/phosphomethylpyrimidine kinase [Dehalococcoidia bacterium]|nr:MAG: bifunctional hydroxymethylpyrimidine kinase/phosphomethylpyrimidine kinase [Dehalococcoidia bacterium]